MKWMIQGLFIVFLTMGHCGPSGTQPSGESVSPGDLETFVQANNRFALELYRALGNGSENLFFSPYSLTSALALTYGGAEGDTARQMAETLHFPPSPDELHPAAHALQEALVRAEDQGAIALRTASALWGDASEEFLEEYLHMAGRYYGAGLKTVNFRNETEPARREINQWVEDRTEDRIQDLLPEGSVTTDTRLVLTNAIYFKGNWETQFEEDHTADRAFTLPSGARLDVPMMARTGEVPYWEDENLQIVELPYEGERLAMVVLLPRNPMGLRDLESLLAPDWLSTRLQGLNQQEVTVILPRFRLVSRFELSPVLASLGMPLAFTPKADFSGMNGKQNLFIGGVVHKAFVEVNEEGTEAAAATGVVMRVTSAPARRIVFQADHPFLYLIRDRETGTILFLGRLTDPEH